MRQIASILKQPLTLFLLKIFGLFLLWEFLYDLYLHPNSSLDSWVVNSTVFLAVKLLNIIGYPTFMGGANRLFGIDNTGGLWVGDPCNGLVLFALFSTFIISFPGKITRKLLYIPLGIIVIYLLNVLRMVALAVIQFYYSRSSVEFHHSYTFTFLVYGAILLMWFLWVKKFSGLSFK